jgi:hypothetical protein
MAAGNTYTQIASTTLGTAASSVTFSSIPSTYTDLVLISSVYKTGGSGQSGVFQLNGDTATNYSFTYLNGNGTSATSGRATSQTYGSFDLWGQSMSDTTFEAHALNFQNYSNTTTYKTILYRGNAVNKGLEQGVNLWRSTAAINSILLFLNAGSFVAGSTFNLYGITSA